MEQQRICPVCNHPNVPTAVFCGRCGTPLERMPEGEPAFKKWGPVLLGILAIVLIAGGAFIVVRFLADRPDDGETPLVQEEEPGAVDTVTVTPLATPLTSTAIAEEGTHSQPSSTPTPQPAATATLPPPSPSPSATPGPSPLAVADIVALGMDDRPVIDGSLAEWLGRTPYHAAHLVHSAAGWDGSQDLVALWYLGWDGDNLYVAVDVTDDTHVQTRSDLQVYRGDSVELLIDTDRPADFSENRPSPDDYQVALSPGDFAGRAPVAFRLRGNNAGQIREAAGHDISLAAQPSPAGYTLEAAIPWSNLAIAPRNGLVMGLALSANDNDTPGTAVQEVMMSTAPNRAYADPTTWGTLTLAAGPDSALPPLSLERNLYLTDPYMSGDDVQMVQERLLELGYDQVGEVDGIFGPLTEAAVKAFQRDEGLDVDGVVGPITWGALFGAETGAEIIEFVVEATERRNDTGVLIGRDNMVTIEYVTGSWRAGPPPTWPLVGPEGDPQVPQKSTFPVPGAPVMSLVAGVGDGTPFLVVEGAAIRSESNQALWLGANDDDFSDNSGALTVRISLAGPTAGAAPTPCPQVALDTLRDTWEEYREVLGCPVSGGSGATGVTVENFQRGQAIWRSDNRQIVILTNNGRWEQFNDTWNEGDREFSCGTQQSPPTPKRGFGKVWCTYDRVRQGLGDATNAERGTTAAIQAFDGGLIIRVAGARPVVLGNDKTWY